MKKDIVKNIARISTVVFVFSTLSFLSGFLSTKTKSGQLDYLTYQLNDYNKYTINKNLIRPFVHIESKEKRDQLYSDLFEQFYYSDDSGSIRQLMTNDCKGKVNGSLEKITLFSQNTFSISASVADDGGYRIDYGIFHSYFSKNELGERYYLEPHFNCDSFIFISDILADALLDSYGLERCEESYVKLIKEEKYAVFHIMVDGEQDLTFSINNIIYSDKRMGPRCSEFNPYFGLINFHYVKTHFQPAFEIDLKAYSFYISSVLNKCESLGYSTDLFNYSFYKFDRENNEYFNFVFANNYYYSVMHYQYSALFNFFFFVSLLVDSICLFFIAKKTLKTQSEIFICLFIFLGELTILSIVANFIYVSYFFSLPLMVMIIAYLFSKGGTVYEKALAFFSQKKYMGRELYFSIEI